MGLVAMLTSQRDLDPAGIAANEEELWRLLDDTRPAVVVLGLHHPGRDGLALCLRIKLRPDPPAVVLYSADRPPLLVVAAAVAGAEALVSRSSSVTTLLQTMRAVALTPRHSAPIPAQVMTRAAQCLDPADHAILAMRIAGDSPDEIAATLGMPGISITRRIVAIVSTLEASRSVAR